MLIPVGEQVQDMFASLTDDFVLRALAIDPGSKYDGYAVSGEKEIALNEPVRLSAPSKRWR